MTVSHDAALGILMPQISNYEMFSIRYRGLEYELGKLGVTAAFAFSHDSYDPVSHGFKELKDSQLQNLYAIPKISVVRDLTMPETVDKPIYGDKCAPTLVHRLALNEFLKDKSNLLRALPEIHPETIVAPAKDVIEASAALMGDLVVVKPVVGSASKDVFVGKKSELGNRSLPANDYLVQEYIDTSKGVGNLGINSVHNVRLLSIDSRIVGAVGRINDAGGRFLHGENDIYSKVYLTEELPDSMIDIADKVHEHLKNLPGSGRNVIAVDVMRGFRPDGVEVDILCEVNRRPLRISAWDLGQEQLDPKGIKWLGQQWDKHEAAMLKAGIDE